MAFMTERGWNDNLSLSTVELRYTTIDSLAFVLSSVLSLPPVLLEMLLHHSFVDMLCEIILSAVSCTTD